MIHPSVYLRFLGPEIGYGVFAQEFLPAGTILCVQDPLDQIIPVSSPLFDHPLVKEKIETYSWCDRHGNRVLGWDFSRYVNHSCSPNSMATGYGLEIIIRDIAANEQITTEYGLLNIEYPLTCYCGEPACRQEIGIHDFDRFASAWDPLIEQALRKIPLHPQPLFALLPPFHRQALENFLNHAEPYLSVYTNRNPTLAVNIL